MLKAMVELQLSTMNIITDIMTITVSYNDKIYTFFYIHTSSLIVSQYFGRNDVMFTEDTLEDTGEKQSFKVPRLCSH